MEKQDQNRKYNYFLTVQSDESPDALIPAIKQGTFTLDDKADN